jgi:hypothetical protein
MTIAFTISPIGVIVTYEPQRKGEDRREFAARLDAIIRVADTLVCALPDCCDRKGTAPRIRSPRGPMSRAHASALIATGILVSCAWQKS